MSSNAIDCSAIEERINGYNLYISTTQEQINKLDPQDPDIQSKQEAITRKLNTLQEQLSIVQGTLEDCRRGKEVNFPPFEILSESDAV